MDCLKTLRTAAAVVGWNHGQNYVIRTMVSAPLLLRETGTLLLIGVTDDRLVMGDQSVRRPEAIGQPCESAGNSGSRPLEADRPRMTGGMQRCSV